MMDAVAIERVLSAACDALAERIGAAAVADVLQRLADRQHAAAEWVAVIDAEADAA